MENKTIEELINDETEKRLTIMERPDYKYPKKITKVDITVIVSGIFVCLSLIVLCMTGVIK